MAQYVTSDACGRMMKCASPSRSPGRSLGSPGRSFGSPGYSFGSPGRSFGSHRRSFGSPGHSFGSPGRSFGNCADFFRTDSAYPPDNRSSSRSSTRVRATLMTDHLATLGIAHNASKTEIKSAYRKLAKQFHPDVCRGDQCQSTFIQIKNAYESALNCVTGPNYALSNCDAENYAEDCREELEDWEEHMGFEGAGSIYYSVDFPCT